MATVVPPVTCANTSGWAVIFDPADGSVAGAQSLPCVLERSFTQWGLIALLDTAGGGKARLLRKSVGSLNGIVQPRFQFPPAFFNTVYSARRDVVSDFSLHEPNAPGFQDGQLSYAGLVQQLTPPRDITEISLASDVVKFVVSHSGRVKCAATDITEDEDLTKPAPGGQKVVFDPSAFLAFWPSYEFDHMKSGLVGDHLRIANVGAYSATADGQTGHGFELIAVADASFHAHATKPAGPQQDKGRLVPECTFSAAIDDTYITGCSDGCAAFATLAAAEATCLGRPDCGGVTWYPGGGGGGSPGYQLRGCGELGKSGIGERSYLIDNAKVCGHPCAAAEPPRLPNINYAPAVFVALREYTPSGGLGAYRYWRTSNSSLQVVAPAVFYANLGVFLAHDEATFSGSAASVRLPGAEGRRQRDQALSGLLLATNNYVGNQANYGDGDPYWSYGVQDNGSLALIPTTVDDVLLDFGLCDTALAHVGFWFDNYVTTDGQIIYSGTWGGVVDGVGDIGRLAALYIKGRHVCSAEGEAWGKRYEHILRAFGTRMLALKAAGTDGRIAPRGPPRPESAGLVAGSPEADWSHFAPNISPDNETWYSVNVWLQRGMDEIAGVLSDDDALGKQLHGNASAFRRQLAASIASSLVPANSSGFPHPLFLPPYARARGGFSVFHNMTEKPTGSAFTKAEPSGVASYTNFRFWPELLIADTLPREIETAFLDWHDSMGGRVGGASRFVDHLDDFPSSGWAYGALTNNNTEGFLALLYGHMATYSSRGSFHNTEQLRFEGEGAYRNYDTSYKGDVALCVVAAVEVARLTRWQLVFEPFRTEDSAPHYGQVWLARGAPTRWFRDPGGFSTAGFTLASAGGAKIAFDVGMEPASQRATYNVSVAGGNIADGAPRFVLRWPGPLHGVPTLLGGCVLVQTEPANGLVVVVPTVHGAETSFAVSAQWMSNDAAARAAAM